MNAGVASTMVFGSSLSIDTYTEDIFRYWQGLGTRIRIVQKWVDERILVSVSLDLNARSKAMPFQITLVRALAALVPACMLFAGSAVLFSRGKTLCSFLQLLGAGCLVVVVLTHVTEALHLFPWMHWGLEHSVGHYLDLGSAILGLTLFPVGYFFHVLTLPTSRPG